MKAALPRIVPARSLKHAECSNNFIVLFSLLLLSVTLILLLSRQTVLPIFILDGHTDQNICISLEEWVC